MVKTRFHLKKTSSFKDQKNRKINLGDNSTNNNNTRYKQTLCIKAKSVRISYTSKFNRRLNKLRLSGSVQQWWDMQNMTKYIWYNFECCKKTKNQWKINESILLIAILDQSATRRKIRATKNGIVHWRVTGCRNKQKNATYSRDTSHFT